MTLLLSAHALVFLSALQVIVAYYNPDVSAMQAEVNKWAIVISALGVLSVLTYTLQHYGFAVVGERLLSRVRRMMMTGVPPLLPGTHSSGIENSIGWRQGIVKEP